MAKKGVEVEASEEILKDIFNQIDEDKSKTIERVELVNFLLNCEFTLSTDVQIKQK